MIEWLLAQIPWWVYLIIAAPFVGAAFYFCTPLIMWIWGIMPRWARWTLGAVVVFILTFVAGRTKGIKLQQEQQKRIEERAIRKRQEIHDDVQKASPSDIDKRLDKWMRD